MNALVVILFLGLVGICSILTGLSLSPGAPPAPAPQPAIAQPVGPVITPEVEVSPQPEVTGRAPEEKVSAQMVEAAEPEAPPVDVPKGSAKAGSEHPPKTNEKPAPRNRSSQLLVPVSLDASLISLGGEIDGAEVVMANWTASHEAPRPEPPSLEACSIYFHNGGTEIVPDELDKLDRVIELLQQNESPGTLLLMGFSDHRGSDTENRQLSERRALAVRDALVQAGAPSSTLRTVGFGACQSARTSPEEELRMDRRVDFVLIP